MGKIAFLFAGQGAQYPGMGKELYHNSPAARAVLEQAEAARVGTLTQCFDASAEELSRTRNTQPCLFAVDLACAAAVVEAGIQPDAVAGFSLGEVAAVTFAGILSAQQGFGFVCKRAALMDACAQNKRGGMSAVLRLDAPTVEQLCAQTGGCWAVNYNCPGQTVVSYTQAVAEVLAQRVAVAGGRTMPLAVSGGFHSPLMDDAAAELMQTLCGIELAHGTLPVYANLTARPYGSNAAELLSAQVNHPVQWQKTIEQLVADGVDTFIEVGAGKTLAGLCKKIVPAAAICSVSDCASLQAALIGVK